MSGWFEYPKIDLNNPSWNDDPILQSECGVYRFWQLKDIGWWKRAKHSVICKASRWFLVYREKIAASGKGVWIPSNSPHPTSVTISMQHLASYMVSYNKEFGTTYYVDLASHLDNRSYYRVDENLLQYSEYVFFPIPTTLSAEQFGEVLRLLQRASGTRFIFFPSGPTGEDSKLYEAVGGFTDFLVFDAERAARFDEYISKLAVKKMRPQLESVYLKVQDVEF